MNWTGTAFWKDDSVQKHLRKHRNIAAAIIAAATIVAGGCATASSPDAWEVFRQQVANACVIASGLGSAVARVDPFGTESYGLASVTGLGDDGTEHTVICVVRKSPGGILNAEISAGFDEWVTVPN
jgi:hypothetical protein